MISDEIRSAIADYVGERIDIDALEERVANLAWTSDIEDRGAAALSSAVIGIIAEFDLGALDEDATRARLAPLVTEWVVPAAPAMAISRSTIKIQTWKPTGWAVVGRRHEAASA